MNTLASLRTSSKCCWARWRSCLRDLRLSQRREDSANERQRDQRDRGDAGLVASGEFAELIEIALAERAATGKPSMCRRRSSSSFSTEE